MNGSFAQDDNFAWLFAGSQRLSLRRIRDSDAADEKRILRSFLPQDDMQLLDGR